MLRNIKGSVISFQTFTKRLGNLRQSRLVQQLNELKEDYIANQDSIANLERELNSVINVEVLLKVKCMKLFSCLNSEKHTPIFISLASKVFVLIMYFSYLKGPPPPHPCAG